MENELRALMPKPYQVRQTKKRICVVDTETDPFAEGRIVKPFAVGFYDGEIYVDFWGPDCVAQFFAFLIANYEPGSLLIYAHNGGRFDFYFFLDYLDHPQAPFIMGARIVQAMFGGQEFRDSYKIIPAPLSGYQKTEISYDLFEADVRENHKRQILDYQKDDCLYLYDLVSEFHRLFGDRLTIGSTALPMLRSFHDYRMMTANIDAGLRRFYYGGRTQAFETGILTPAPGRRFYIYDRNSMYPAVMRDEPHPVGSLFSLGRVVTEKTAFVCVEGINEGGLPSRADDGSLDFTRRRGTFWITAHEYRAGIETGTFRPLKILHTRDCEEWTTFGDFITHFYESRLEAKANGDKIRDLFFKLLMNSSYGKFAQNPEKYESFELRDALDPPEQSELRSELNPSGWYPATVHGETFIWARPSPHAWKSYKNVAIAASITGAARANLLRNIALAERPMYCDTDSIICEGFTGPVDDKALGGWKCEAEADLVAIAGKKLYAVFTLDKPEGAKESDRAFYRGREYWCIKLASKGAKLTGAEIIRLCMGETVCYKNPVPNFKLDGTAEFVHRNIRATGNGQASA